MLHALLLAFAFVLLWPMMAHAQGANTSVAASDWAETAHGNVRLIAGVEATGDRASVPLGLEFQLSPGWHVYWRSPGDAGYPPRPDWAGSENLARAEMRWPAPVRFSGAGLETIGYAEAVVFPIDAVPVEPGRPLALRATVDYLTCKDICVPYVVDLMLNLPAGPATASAFAHPLARAAAQVPGDGRAHGLALVAVTPVADGTRLQVDVDAREPFVAPDLFVEAPPPLLFGAPTVTLADGGRRATLVVNVYNAEGNAPGLAGLPVTLTVTDGDRAAEWASRIAPAAAAADPGSAPADRRQFASILLLAVLGGLILNLMPCVLPVLSMKLLAVVGHAGSERSVVRQGFLATAAGILASFLLLALAMVALQQAGASLGWGIQFQQPWFLAGMAMLVTVFACNLWGLFEVPMPGGVGRLDAQVARAPGRLQHFLTGALATLLATPCSAPFLGTAVGFALSRGPAEIVTVFLAVGLGLAVPYLAVAAVPQLATRLPRPGAWMRTLRRGLALALLATAAWLLWVLAGQIGTAEAGVVGVLAAALIAAFAVRRRLPGRYRALAGGAVGLLFVLAVAVSTGQAGLSRPADPAVEAQAGPWQPFAVDRIERELAAGRIVFVNVTADWCLTCKLNERLVLANAAVRARLGAPGIVAMQADWTVPDPKIAAYLASFGRYGIPFDAVYGPALPRGEALPELLSVDLVLSALDRAGAAATAERR